jgi:hypothetical protein
LRVLGLRTPRLRHCQEMEGLGPRGPVLSVEGFGSTHPSSSSSPRVSRDGSWGGVAPRNSIDISFLPQPSLPFCNFGIRDSRVQISGALLLFSVGRRRCLLSLSSHLTPPPPPPPPIEGRERCEGGWSRHQRRERGRDVSRGKVARPVNILERGWPCCTASFFSSQWHRNQAEQRKRQ